MNAALSVALPDPTLFWFLVPIVFLASFIFTTIGFGGGVVAVPIAALVLEPLVILPVLAIIETFTVLRMAYRNPTHIVRGDAMRLIPASALGTVFGTTLLVNLPVRWLMFGMAAFVTCFLAARLFTTKSNKPIARSWAWPMGALAGLCSGAFGAGGPPTAIFLNMRRHSLMQARSTIAASGTANLLFRLVAFTVAGLYAPPKILLTGLWLLPVAYVSVQVAEQVRHRISDQRILMATFGILALSAISLFLRALWMP